MGESAALYCDVVLETLAEKPREVDGGIYTDRLEDCAGVAGGWKFGFFKDTELYSQSVRAWRLKQPTTIVPSGCCYLKVDAGIIVFTR